MLKDLYIKSLYFYTGKNLYIEGELINGEFYPGWKLWSLSSGISGVESYEYNLDRYGRCREKHDWKDACKTS